MNLFFDEEEFNKIYKGTKKFCEESIWFSTFLEGLNDKDLFSHIEFCNEYLQIPPIITFLKFYMKKKEMKEYIFERNEKRCLGACFGYLFKKNGKEPVSVWVGDQTTGIKNASYFK